MGRKCIVPGWKSGYDNNSEHVSLFGVPKDDELRAKWVSVIPTTKIPITSAYIICKKYFLDSDIKHLTANFFFKFLKYCWNQKFSIISQVFLDISVEVLNFYKFSK